MAPPVVFLACKVFDGAVDTVEGVIYRFLDYGLHSLPQELKKNLQLEIDRIDVPSRIVLGYGLCGNGLDGIQAGKHTLIVPKVDDCVAIFIGSRQRFLELFNAKPATYYLTKGWLEVGSDPLNEFEELVEKYGPKTAAWLMERQYQHYERLLFVAHCEDDFDTYRPRALRVAEYCTQFGMVYEEYLGERGFLDQIAAVLNSQGIIPAEFIVVLPGSTVRQEMFR